MRARTHPHPKPRLRGVSHLFAFFVFLAANAWLFGSVQGPAAKRAVLLYAVSLAFLYGVSATFHRRVWTVRGQRRMQRLDHSAIFVLIAGSYSPLFIMLGDQQFALDPLVLVWGLAACGIAKSLLWAHGPAWITAALAIGVGWSASLYVAALRPEMGEAAFYLLLVSGAVYSLGGVIYARRRPDPVPHVFGYHEVFHACVVLGSALHFGHTICVLRAAGALGS